MSSMFVAGTVCWVVAGILGILFQYEAQNKMTGKGVVLKALTAFCMTGYAFVLIVLFGEFSSASINFVVGMLLVTVGDIFIAYLEYKGDGSTQAIIDAGEGGSKTSLAFLCVTGSFFICSYFFQMVAFIKAISQFDVATNYVVPFLVFFILPSVFTVLGGLLSRFKIPDVELSVFIIGVFYILLTSALFASASVFAFSLFSTDPIHSTLIFLGGVLFFLSMLVVELRYSKPSKYENKLMRMTSRFLTFLSRMILAGCAFLL